MRLFLKEVTSTEGDNKLKPSNMKRPVLVLGCMFENEEDVTDYNVTVDMFGWAESVFLCVFEHGDEMEIGNAIAVGKLHLENVCNRIRAIQMQSYNGFVSPETLVLDPELGGNTVEYELSTSISEAVRNIIGSFINSYLEASGQDSEDFIIEYDSRYRDVLAEFSDGLKSYLKASHPVLKDGKEQGMFADFHPVLSEYKT